MNTLTLSAENLDEIHLIVFEIWPGSQKSRGAFIHAGAFIQQNTVSEKKHGVLQGLPPMLKFGISYSCGLI